MSSEHGQSHAHTSGKTSYGPALAMVAAVTALMVVVAALALMASHREPSPRSLARMTPVETPVRD